MRGLILNRIRESLLTSNALADFLKSIEGDHYDWFDAMMQSLEKRATDKQLLSLYDQLQAGIEIIPHGIGQHDCVVGLTLHRRIIGGMETDGSIHT